MKNTMNSYDANEMMPGAEETLKLLIRRQKSNPFADKGAVMRTLYEFKEDGEVEVTMPPSAAPDSVGYNLNRAFQMARPARVKARLQRRLERNQKTLVDYARELEQKALTPCK